MRKQGKLRFKVKSNMVYISIILFLLLLALFFKVALKGYSFLALVLVIIAVIIGAYYGLTFKNTQLFLNLKKILSVIVVLGCLLIIVAEIPVIVNSNKREKADSPYLIVLGAGVHGTRPSRILSQRINAAYDFLTAYPDTIAILSGGKGKDEEISEALCMKNELIKKGIDESRLILEDRSTTTKENFAFSKKILEEIAPKTTSITVISSDTHLYRAQLIAKESGLQAKVYYAYTDYHILRLSNFLREAVAVWAEWLF